MILNFLGDIMLGREIATTINKNYKQKDFVYSEIKKHIPVANETIANLESPFLTNGKSRKFKDPHLTFKNQPQLARILTEIGITSVTLANNHITDYGLKGVETTIQTLNNEKIKHIGAGINLLEALSPLTINDNPSNNSIGIFAFNAFMPFSTLASKKKFGVAGFNKKNINYVLKKYSHDFEGLIFAVHWGIDYYHFPIPRFMEFAKELLEKNNKVIAIVGHHPHLQQPVIIHKNKHIFCSLGNFLFDEPFYLSRIGSILSLKIENNKIVNYDIIFTKLEDDYKIRLLQDKQLETEKKRVKEVRSKMNNQSNEYLMVDKIWIKYLIYQFIRYFSTNELKQLFTFYSPITIVKRLLL